MMMASNSSSAIRRAHRGLPARPLSKENLPCASGWQHQNNSVASKPATRPSSSPADIAHFSGFVRLLASKDEHQRAVLVQRALQQAENVSSAISAGRFAADSRPSLGDESKGMRRASSADNLRRRPTSPHPQNTNAARLLTRRHEAALAQREAAAFATEQVTPRPFTTTLTPTPYPYPYPCPNSNPNPNPNPSPTPSPTPYPYPTPYPDSTAGSPPRPSNRG